MAFHHPLAILEFSRSLPFFVKDTGDTFLIVFLCLVRLLRLFRTVLSIELHHLVELYPRLFIKGKK